MAEVNRFGVPHRVYRLELADNSSYTVDVGCEEDWGDIQKMRPTDYPAAHPAGGTPPAPPVAESNNQTILNQTISLADLATGRTYRNIHYWATHRVWCYVKNYAA